MPGSAGQVKRRRSEEQRLIAHTCHDAPSLLASVHVAPVADVHDQDDQLLVLDLANDSVATNSQTIQIVHALELLGAFGPRIFVKSTRRGLPVMHGRPQRPPGGGT